jgi:rare lipoprotein A
MRSIIGFAAMALAVMFTGTSAANASWECQGPEMACKDATSAPSGKQGKVSYKKSKKSSYTATASLSGDDEAPVKKSKKAKKSYSDNDGDSGSTYSGKASYYWEPQALASGGRFNPNAMTAAHKTLPFGTKVRVTNQNNGESVVVVINDRGPYVAGRIIDLSKAAAHAINMQGSGVVPVKVAVLGKG